MKAKERGKVLDVEAEAFLADVECVEPYDEPLAITTTLAFNVDHENTYDSDVDEDPHAAAVDDNCRPFDQAIVDRNRRNEELRKETKLLKAKLSFQTKVNKTLESDKAQILSDNNVSDDKYIEEIVCLKNANQVMSDLLKTYQ
nr:hypothetical protein [Tanacetum cinerariifolium]